MLTLLKQKLCINEMIKHNFVNITIDSASYLFAVKKIDKESIRFHRTWAILSKQTTKIRYKIWKMKIFCEMVVIFKV